MRKAKKRHNLCRRSRKQLKNKFRQSKVINQPQELNDQEDKAAETKKKNDATAKKNAEDLQEAVLAYKKSSVDGQIEIINAERQRLLALATMSKSALQ